jgi:hypothetical protein
VRSPGELEERYSILLLVGRVKSGRRRRSRGSTRMLAAPSIVSGLSIGAALVSCHVMVILGFLGFLDCAGLIWNKIGYYLSSPLVLYMSFAALLCCGTTPHLSFALPKHTGSQEWL